MTYLKQCQEAETEFREAMVALVHGIEALPRQHWAQFQAELEQLLHQPADFEQFVEQAPSPKTAQLLRETQRRFRAWHRAIAGGRASPRAGPEPASPPPRKQPEFVRDQALAVSYAHRVRDRFVTEPERYAAFIELVHAYEVKRFTTDGLDGDPVALELLNAALLVETTERLGKLFGTEHADLVEGFRACIPPACVAAAAS